MGWCFVWSNSNSKQHYDATCHFVRMRLLQSASCWMRADLGKHGFGVQICVCMPAYAILSWNIQHPKVSRCLTGCAGPNCNFLFLTPGQPPPVGPACEATTDCPGLSQLQGACPSNCPFVAPHSYLSPSATIGVVRSWDRILGWEVVAGGVIISCGSRFHCSEALWRLARAFPQGGGSKL